MPKRILLVEDEALIAMNEAQMLENYGYEVVTVHSGTKAIQAVASDPEISLILMDIDLGRGMDGTEAAEEILNKKDIPVVFLSSHTEPEVVRKTEKITSYGYVVKNSGATVLDASIKMAFKLYESYTRYNKRNQELYALAEELEESNEELTCIEEDLRKREASLAESDNRFRSVLQLVPDMISIHDPDMNILYSNWRSFAEVPESKRRIHTKCYKTYRNLDEICPDCLAKTVLKTGKPLRKEAELPEGMWVDIRAIPVLDKNNNVTMFVEWVRDITEEKANRKNLKQSEEEYRRLFETMSPGVVYQSADGTIISANPAAEKMLGLTVDQMNGKTSMDPRWKMVDGDGNDVPGPEHPAMVALRTGEKVGPLDRAVFIPEKNKYIWLSITAIPHFHPGDKKPYQVYSTFEDITERKRAEEAQRKSGEKTLAILHALPDLMFIQDSAGTYLDYYASNEDDLYVKPERFIGQQMQHILPQEISHQLFSLLEKALSTKDVQIGEYELSIAGEQRAYEARFTPYNSDKVISIMRDITERKQAEEQAQELRERLRKIIENSPLSIVEIDASGHYVLVNEATNALLNTTKEQLLGKHFEEVVSPETASVYRERIDYVSKTGEMLTVDDTLHIDQQEQIVRTVLFPIYRTGEALPSIIGMAYEITKEMRLLKEKDFLMKELNHRVKNNLFMVSSLINLKNSETRIDLSDVQHQIEAIGLIHEKLYQTGNIAEICCRDYFDDLLNSIFSSFSTRPVKIEADIDEIPIPTKSAMSLGLIVNEIATNAIKHGFSDTEEAVFTIKMQKDRENNQYELTLSNTGNPFPEDIDLDNPQTLGLRLISVLTTQLDGTLELKRGPTPVFTIQFPKIEN